MDAAHGCAVVDGAGSSWRVAAIIDWEKAFAGSQLYDIGHFLRYEDGRAPLLEPHFSRGFRAWGGVLPSDWRQFARIVDAAALATGLAKAQLAAGPVAELRALLRATIDESIIES